MIDINELRRQAQAATPGPWKTGQYLGSLRQFVIRTDVGDKGRGSNVAFTSTTFDNDEIVANARLIAAANPAVINELLDRLEASEADALEQARLNGMGAERELALMAKLEAAEKERDALRAELLDAKKTTRELFHNANVANMTITTLQAKIAEMENQKPVAWISSRNGFIVKENKNPDYNLPLIHAPGAKGE